MRASRVLLLIIAGLIGSAARAATDEAWEARAKSLLDLLAQNKFAEFVAAGTPEMQAAFTPPQAAQTWMGVQFQLGKFKRVDSTAVTHVGELGSVSCVCTFERGTLTLRLVLDDQMRLGGMWFDAITPDWSPPDYADLPKFSEVGITVSDGEFILHGLLSLPSVAAGTVPCVVLVHGSGPNDRDETLGPNRVFKDLAWGLASRGVAVLRYDKRTKVYPQAYGPGEWTVENEVIDDALAAVRLARKRPEVNGEQVFVLGHSLGAWAAPLIAEKDADLAGILMLAASARPMVDVVEEQLRYLVSLGGATVTPEQLREHQEMLDTLEIIRKRKVDEKTPDLLGVPAVYWDRINRIDPTPIARKLTLPMFVLQGGRDYQVTAADFALWKKALADRKNVTCKLYPALNHLFITGAGMSTPTEYTAPGHVDREVVEDIARWVKEQAR